MTGSVPEDEKGMIQHDIERLRDELEDLEDTFAFNLNNTSAHVNSSLVAEHEEELEEFRQKISQLEARL